MRNFQFKPQENTTGLWGGSDERNVHTILSYFLGAFSKSRKSPVTPVMSVHLSIDKEQFCSHWTELFVEFLYWRLTGT